MKNANNWKLVALFGGLALIFVAVRMFRSPLMEGNMPASLTDIDTAKVSELVIVPARQRDVEIRLVKTGKWQLKKGDGNWRLDQGAAEGALRQLMSVKPKRMVTKKKSKWREFSVSDSTGTRVKVFSGSSVVADVWIGRSGFVQSAGQQFTGESYTFVRMNEEEEVYAVEGFLDGQFNRAFDDWRDKSFMRIKRDSINRIVFQYPADSSFKLEKRQGKWLMGSMLADSAAVASFLGGLEYRNLQPGDVTEPAGAPPIVATFGNDSRVMAKVEAWPGPSQWTLRSSHQPETYFNSAFDAIKDILAGNKRFVQTKKAP